jgi:hypothetical protein
MAPKELVTKVRRKGLSILEQYRRDEAEIRTMLDRDRDAIEHNPRHPLHKNSATWQMSRHGKGSMARLKLALDHKDTAVDLHVHLTKTVPANDGSIPYKTDERHPQIYGIKVHLKPDQPPSHSLVIGGHIPSSEFSTWLKAKKIPPNIQVFHSDRMICTVDVPIKEKPGTARKILEQIVQSGGGLIRSLEDLTVHPEAQIHYGDGRTETVFDMRPYGFKWLADAFGFSPKKKLLPEPRKRLK